MSCGAPLVPTRVSQAIEERRRADKRAEELEFELARLVADGFMNEMKRSEITPFVKHYHRVDDPSRALAFLQSIATAFIACASSLAEATGHAQPYTIVFTSSPPEKRSTSVTTVLVLGSDDGRAKAVGEALKAQLGVKGGGRGERWSGKWIGVWREAKEGATVGEILKTTIN